MRSGRAIHASPLRRYHVIPFVKEYYDVRAVTKSAIAAR